MPKSKTDTLSECNLYTAVSVTTKCKPTRKKTARVHSLRKRRTTRGGWIPKSKSVSNRKSIMFSNFPNRKGKKQNVN